MKLGFKLSVIGTIIMFIGLQIANFAFVTQHQKFKELEILLDRGQIAYASYQEQKLEILHTQYDEYLLYHIPFAIGVIGVAVGFIVSCLGLRKGNRKFSYYGILTSIAAIFMYILEQLILGHIYK